MQFLSPQIHLFPIELGFIEVQQVHRARHSFVTILISCDDAAIIQ